MTPRMVWAYLRIGAERQAQEEKRQLWLHTMAARGDMKKVNSELKKKTDAG